MSDDQNPENPSDQPGPGAAPPAPVAPPITVPAPATPPPAPAPPVAISAPKEVWLTAVHISDPVRRFGEPDVTILEVPAGITPQYAIAVGNPAKHPRVKVIAVSNDPGFVHGIRTLGSTSPTTLPVGKMTGSQVTFPAGVRSGSNNPLTIEANPWQPSPPTPTSS